MRHLSAGVQGEDWWYTECMLIELSQLKGLPVASLNDEATIGMIDDTLIHPDTGEVIGFWVKPPGWFVSKQALSSRDVAAYEAGAILVNSADSLVAPDDMQPFKSVAKRNDRWLGKAVETESGEQLGKVTDAIVDTDLERLAKIHIGSLFGPDRILSRNEIVKVTKTRIIVLDALESKTPGVVVPEVAA